MPKELILPSSKPAASKRSLWERLHYYWLVSRWLSLDVAAGALVSCLMACKLLQVSPVPWEAVWVLAATVLLIYTADHLQDVWQTAGRVFSPRRQFHWQYRKHLLLGAVLVACMVAVMVIFFLPPKMIFFGLVLAMLVGVYLWLVHKLGVDGGRAWFHKELIIACLYTAGIWGVALFAAADTEIKDLLFAGAFLLTALQNLLLFSYFELEEDYLQRQRSMAVNLGTGKVRKLLWLLFGLSGLLLLLTWNTGLNLPERQVIFTQAAMSGILGMLFIFPDYFSRYRRYRWLGDGVFLLPVWLLV
jgi:hypothetical protein